MIVDLFYPYYRNLIANIGGDNFNEIYNFEDCFPYIYPDGTPDKDMIIAAKKQIIQDVLEHDPKRDIVLSGKFAGGDIEI